MVRLLVYIGQILGVVCAISSSLVSVDPKEIFGNGTINGDLSTPLCFPQEHGVAILRREYCSAVVLKFKNRYLHDSYICSRRRSDRTNPGYLVLPITLSMGGCQIMFDISPNSLFVVQTRNLLYEANSLVDMCVGQPYANGGKSTASGESPGTFISILVVASEKVAPAPLQVPAD